MQIDETAPMEYPLGPFTPCSIIAVDYHDDNPLIMKGVQYDMFRDFDRVRVYK